MSSISKGQASAGLVEDESATDGPGDSNDEAIREENEQWERTWDILMSMISKVIPYARRPTGTGDERRSDLIAAVGKLIQASYSAGEVKQLRRECATLKRKVSRNREKLEEHLNEVREAKEQRLIDTLAGVHRQMQVHIESQRRTLRKWDRDGRKRSIEQRMTLESARPMRKKRVTLQENNGEEFLRRFVDSEEDSDLEGFAVEKRGGEDLDVGREFDSEETSEGCEAKRQKLATSSSDEECFANGVGVEGCRYGSSSSEEEMCRKGTVSRKPKRVSSSSDEDSESKGTVSKKPKRVSSSSEDDSEDTVSKRHKFANARSQAENGGKHTIAPKPKLAAARSQADDRAKRTVLPRPKRLAAASEGLAGGQSAALSVQKDVVASAERDSDETGFVLKNKGGVRRSDKDSNAKCTTSKKLKFVAPSSEDEDHAKGPIVRERERDEYRAKDNLLERMDSPAEATMPRRHRLNPCSIPKETVNRLIAATNQMRSDYRTLRQMFSDAEPLDSASDISELTD